MSLSNKEVKQRIKESFENMQGHLNLMETELQKEDEDFSKSKVALSAGKLMKSYEDIAYLMGIFDNKPKYQGN